MTVPTTAPRRRLGRLRNSGKPRIWLGTEHIPQMATYVPPAALDRYSAVPPGSWGMDANDHVGCCTIADGDHEVKADQVAAGNTEVSSADAEILAVYSAITGYDPSQTQPDGSNPTDQGAEMQDVRSFWQKQGFVLGGQPHKILMFAQLAHGDDTLIKWALDQFGALGLGVNLPASAQDQFNAEQPWTVVEGSEIEGGHAIALVGYDADWWYVVTWGAVVKVAPAWFAQYVEEVWTVLDEDFVNAHTGADPLGATLYALGQQFAAVTHLPNPVPEPSPGPAPAPTPTPAPSPVPVPAPADPDEALAAVALPWVQQHYLGRAMEVEHMARALEAWLAAKGL